MKDELKAKVDDLLAGKTKSPEAVAEVVRELVAALEEETTLVASYRDLSHYEQSERVKAEEKIQSLKTIVRLL